MSSPEDPRDLDKPKPESDDQRAESSDADDDLADVLPPEVARSMPPHLRAQFSAFVSGPMQHPLARKVTPEHLTDMIGFVKEEGGRQHWREMADKGVMLAVVVLALLFILALVWMLKDQDNPEILRTIIVAVVSFLGGLGLGTWRSRS